MSESTVELNFRLSYADADRLLRFLMTKATTGILLFWAQGELMSDTITLRDNGPQFTCTVAYADAEGFPTAPDNTPQWTVDDENVANIVETAEDGLTITLNPGSPGATQLHAHLENNDGTSVDLVGTISVVAGEAVTGMLEFTEGTPPPTP